MSDALKMEAQRFLGLAGFETKYLAFSDLSSQILVASNEYVTVAILAGTTRADVYVDVDVCAVLFPNWVAENARTKMWDIYIVSLIADDPKTKEDFGWAEGIENDTRRVRKLVRWGVLPEQASVKRALGMFLPLPTTDSIQLPDPLDALTESLRQHGVPSETAAASVESFRRTGEVAP